MNKPEFSTTTKGPIAEHYDNFIGGKWAAPRSGKYFDDISPANRKSGLQDPALRRTGYNPTEAVRF